MEKVLYTNRIDEAIEATDNLLSIYFTAGYPDLDDTLRIARQIADAGADMLEIGIPFSDPVADGPTIQESSEVALANGMTLEVLFDQLQELRAHVSIPVLLMSYINPILQYGVERFCSQCAHVGIDGLIIPDLPVEIYLSEYQNVFKAHQLHNILLIGPNTSEERLHLIDHHASGFVYMVSSSSITGTTVNLKEEQIDYFERIETMKLSTPRVIGFGISDHETFKTACSYASGAIIGSAFIRQLKMDAGSEAIEHFIKTIKQS